MFDNSLNLAEKKLLLLYIIDKIDLPISNIQLTEIVLENNFINYFTLQEYIDELISSNLIIKVNQNEKDRLTISSKGKEVLSLFKNRLSDEDINKLNTYIGVKMNLIKKEATISADYTIENGNSYVVSLSASENNIPLMEIKVTVASNKQARELCTKWKANPSDLYTKIIKVLSE
ncbi:MAG: DUF4364 family protein [Clostridium sp.]|uniref:DUF4364 family protein n=1 Tax=Clostridium culturomicium TaxID=1499683 RepID=UPI00058BD18B|nr:DUF4364 family protein [Clostridium culturomicium]MDU4892065.1 DUF4364 family protein [Clostridium sp.]MDU7082452.1 DUF4364 family protein [Clostridium sp.]